MAADYDSGVAVTTMKEKILGLEVQFYVLRMKQSFLLWIGTEPPQFEALSVSMLTKFVSACILSYVV